MLKVYSSKARKKPGVRVGFALSLGRSYLGQPRDPQPRQWRSTMTPCPFAEQRDAIGLGLSPRLPCPSPFTCRHYALHDYIESQKGWYGCRQTIANGREMTLGTLASIDEKLDSINPTQRLKPSSKAAEDYICTLISLALID